MINKTHFMDIYDIVGKDSGALRNKHILFSLNLINFQKINPKLDTNFPAHVHTCFELIIPVGEQYCCTLCNKELTVPAESFLLIQPGQSHCDHLSKKEPFLCIHFNLYSHNGKEQKQQIFIPGLQVEKQIAQIPSKEFIYDIFKLAEKNTDHNIPIYVFDNFFGAVFQLLIDIFPPEYIMLDASQETIQNYTYQRIFNYFNDCLANNNFSIAEFSKILNCSPRTLARICNEYFYQPPHRAFQTYRLQAALYYLQKNPTVTVKEVSQIFGFPNEFYFSKTFKKQFGTSPSKIKSEIK